MGFFDDLAGWTGSVLDPARLFGGPAIPPTPGNGGSTIGPGDATTQWSNPMNAGASALYPDPRQYPLWLQNALFNRSGGMEDWAAPEMTGLQAAHKTFTGMNAPNYNPGPMGGVPNPRPYAPHLIDPPQAPPPQAHAPHLIDPHVVGSYASNLFGQPVWQTRTQGGKQETVQPVSNGPGGSNNFFNWQQQSGDQWNSWK